jgi:hypothetical protein
MDTISCGACPTFKNIRIIDLIEGETENFSEMLFWLKKIRISTNEMDGIVKRIKRNNPIEKE